jgi:UDP-N-acetylmuramoyl-L-alanyl-D-glutamate--2,6-diaminopimelate ligase
VSGAPVISLGGSIPAGVSGAAIDSRKVTAGCLFSAFPRQRPQWRGVYHSAVERGAVAIVARPEGEVEGAVHWPMRAAATVRAPRGQIARTLSRHDRRGHRDNGIGTSTVEMATAAIVAHGGLSFSVDQDAGVTTADDR